MMFDDTRGNSRPVSRIHRIGPEVTDGPRKGMHHVAMIDDEEFYIYKFEAKRIDAFGHPVIPAEPNTALVTFHKFCNTASDEWCATEQPIVAWRIEPDGPEPVVLTSSLYRSKSYTAIRFPDGVLRDREGEEWDSLEAFEEQARGWCIADQEGGSDTAAA